MSREGYILPPSVGDLVYGYAALLEDLTRNQILTLVLARIPSARERRDFLDGLDALTDAELRRVAAQKLAFQTFAKRRGLKPDAPAKALFAKGEAVTIRPGAYPVKERQR